MNSPTMIRVASGDIRLSDRGILATLTVPRLSSRLTGIGTDCPNHPCQCDLSTRRGSRGPHHPGVDPSAHPPFAFADEFEAGEKASKEKEYDLAIICFTVFLE